MTNSPAAIHEARLAGAAWMLLATGIGSGIDAIVKLLQAGFETPQIVLLRIALSLPLVLATALAAGGVAAVRPNRWHPHLLRALCASGSAFGFFYGLGELPLMLAVSIGFTAPLLIALLSAPLLGERVGAVRWGGSLLGFGGVLVALQPGTVKWDPAMLAVLGSAGCWALLAISARRFGESEPAGALVLGTMPLSATIGAVLAIPVWKPPTIDQWLAFAALGALGSLVHYCVLTAYRRSRAAVVAPMEYSALLWSAGLGWLFWQEVPTASTVIGAVVIAAAGIIVLRAKE